MFKINLSLISRLAKMDGTIDGWCSAQYLLEEEFNKARLTTVRTTDPGFLIEIPTDESAWRVFTILEKRPEIVWEIWGPYCLHHNTSKATTAIDYGGYEMWVCSEKSCQHKMPVSGGKYLSLKNMQVKKERAVAGHPTGRLSVQSPRLQNIPIKSEVGKEIRKDFYNEMADAFIYACEHRLSSPRDLTQYGDLDMAAEALSKGKPVAFAAKPSIEDPLVATLVKARNLVEGAGGKIIVQYEPMKHVLPVTALKLAEELREKAKEASTGLATGDWRDLERRADLLKKFAEDTGVPIITESQKWYADKIAELDKSGPASRQTWLKELGLFDLDLMKEQANKPNKNGDLLAIDTETTGYVAGVLKGRRLDLNTVSRITQYGGSDVLGSAVRRAGSQELDERARIDAAKAVMLGQTSKEATVMDIAAKKQEASNIPWQTIRVNWPDSETSQKRQEFYREYMGEFTQNPSPGPFEEYLPKNWPFHMRQIPRDPEFRQKAKSCSFGDLRSTGVVIPGKNPITERVKAILGEKYSKEAYFAWLYGKPLHEPEEDKTIAHLQKKNEEMEKLLREKLHELEELGGANLLNKNALRMALNREADLKAKLKMLEESIEPKKGENT